MSRIGLEIGRSTLRAVRIEGDTTRTFEADWDPDIPAAAIADLVDSLGRARSVAVAIDTSLLRVRRLELPPLPVADRRRALRLESDRHFAAADPLAFGFAEADGLTFAVPEARLEIWVAALDPLGPLVRLEPAPVALARTLADAGTPDADMLRELADGVEWSRFRGGRLVDARRVFGSVGDAVDEVPVPDDDVPIFVEPWRLPAFGQETTPAPTPHGLAPRFLAAFGATLDGGEGWERGFVIETLQRDLGRRRALRRAGAVVALGAALVFGILSWDGYRDRVEAKVDERISQLRDAVAPVMALEEEVGNLQRSLAALDRIEASRPDVLGSLRALTNVVPEDTWLRTLQVSGADWQIQGLGNDAAALIPLLDRHPRFEDVRFAAATRRIQSDNTSYDDFALTFRTTRPAE